MRGFIPPIGLLCACLLNACGFFADAALSSPPAKPASQVAAPMSASPAPSKFQAQSYNLPPAADPFNDQRLALAYQKAWQTSASQGSLLRAELHRKREGLEEFPLESIRMVGHMRTEGGQVALVKVDTVLYSVRLGSHLGQNFGRVLEITDRGLSLRELVQDPAGKWTKRKTTLVLQEGLK